MAKYYDSNNFKAEGANVEDVEGLAKYSHIVEHTPKDGSHV